MSALKVLVLVALCAGGPGSAYEISVAGLGDAPHHAAVYLMTEDGDYTFKCSAAVVGAKAVVTTATCAKSLSGRQQVAVSAGMLLRQNENNTYLNVSEMIQHEDFDPDTRANNVALLKLVTGFEESAVLSSVPLREDHVANDSLCTISGWRTDFMTVRKDLRWSNATVRECPASVQNGSVCLNYPDDDMFECLLGDEGSPIVCKGLLTGLLTNGVGTCLSIGEPWVSTEISAHADWIRQKMAAPEGTTAAPKPSTTTTRRPTTPTTPPPGSEYESKVAVVGEVPHQAAVWSVHVDRETGDARYDFACAGSVVGQRFVLTTATCADSVSGSLAVSAGFVSRNDPSVQHLNVTEVIKHEDYAGRSGEDDIALLRITPGFTLSTNLSVIPLSETTAAKESLCTASGWQQDMFTVGNGLKYSNVSMIDCKDDKEDSGIVCAGFPKSLYFQCLVGDEGGPLACGGSLTGVLNYDMDACMFFPEPGSYTDVAFYRQWIEEAMSRPPATTTTVGSSDATTSAATVGSSDATTSAPTVGSSDATTSAPTVGSSDATTSAPTVGSSDATTTAAVGSSDATTIQDGGPTTGILEGNGGASGLVLSVASVAALVCASIFNSY